MKRFLRRLFGREPAKPGGDYPSSMKDLHADDPCWCGSEKTYQNCHRPDDRRREKELGLRGGKTSICDAFV